MDVTHNPKIENSLVSVIILNYNDIEHIENCLDSVFKTIGCKFEVLLVDNASTDGSSLNCKKKFPQIRLYQNKENLAMAGRNIGIDNANGDYIVFLDSDATVDPCWLENLIKSYLTHGQGLYQGKILETNNPQIIGSSGNLLNIFGFGYARGNGENDIGQYENFEQISFPVGACLFSSLETIKKIGYFDESNLLYLMYDDVDYGWKALTLGIFSFYEPKSIIYHPKSTSSKLTSHKMFLLNRNRWICLLSYYSTKTLVKFFPLFFVLEFGLFLFLILNRMSIAKIKAFFSLLKMYPSIKQRKTQLNRKRKLSDNEIITHFVTEMAIPENMSKGKLSTFYVSVIKCMSKFAQNLI
jgi:GT2 family glycosyltransferase